MIGYMITAHNNGSMCDRGEIYLEGMNLDKLFLELKYPEETEQMIRNERTCRKEWFGFACGIIRMNERQ